MSDFQSEYGIELETWRGTWRAFKTRLAGLLCANTRLGRHFQPDE